MDAEVMSQFISQLIDNLNSIITTLELPLQHYQVEAEENKSSKRISGEVLHALLIRKTMEGKGDAVKTILLENNATRFSELDSERFEEVYFNVAKL